MSEKTQTSQYYMDILSENVMKKYSTIEYYYFPSDDSDILWRFSKSPSCRFQEALLI